MYFKETNMPRVIVGKPREEEIRPPKWPILAIVLIAFLLRLPGTWHGLPHPASGEERRVVHQAFGFTINKQHLPEQSDKPVVMSYVLSGEYGAYFGIRHLFGGFRYVHEYESYFYKKPAVFYVLARLTGAIFGILGVYALYRVSSALFGWGVGIMSACMLAVEPHHVMASMQGTGDGLALIFAMIGLYYLANTDEERRLGSSFVAAVFIGLAASVSYWYAALFLFVVIGYFVTVPANYRVAAWVGGIPFLPVSFLFGFLLPNGVQLVRWREFAAGVLDSFLKNASMGSITEAGPRMSFIRSLVEVRVPADGLGWGIVGVGCLGILSGAIFAKRGRLKFAVLAAFAATAFALFFPWERQTFDRWCMVLSVPLSIGAAHLVYRVCWNKRIPAKLALVCMIAVTAAVAAQMASQSGLMAARRTADDTRFQFGEWAKANIPDAAKVVVTPEADVLFHTDELPPDDQWGKVRQDVLSTWNNKSYEVSVLSIPYAKPKLPDFEGVNYLVLDGWSMDRAEAQMPPVGRRLLGKMSGIKPINRLVESTDAQGEQTRALVETIDALRQSHPAVKSFPQGEPRKRGYGPSIDVVVLVPAPEPVPAKPAAPVVEESPEPDEAPAGVEREAGIFSTASE
jgi:hypothetical protein